METNWNQLIERYLNGELSPEGKAAFEGELKNNPELQKELELHQLTQTLIKRAALRDMVAKGGKTFHLKQKLIKAGLVIAVAAVVATAIVLLSGKNPNTETEQPQQERIEQSLLDEMNKDLQFANIDPQYFKFTGLDDVFLSETGVLLSITKGSFLLNGKPYHGEAIVQWQEAQRASDIVKAGLSTMSGDRLLETQGMFSLNAYTPEGKKLELSRTGVYVQVPVNELKKDMMLFQGVKGENGNIDWQNPTKLERLPKPKSMAKMDLYPPKYEPKLNELKWFKQKEKRDSLYLSFDERVVEPAIADSISTDAVDVSKSNSVFVEPQESPEFDWSTIGQPIGEAKKWMYAIGDTIYSTQSSDKLSKTELGYLLYTIKCATCHNPHTEATGPKLAGVRAKWEKEGAKPGSIYQWVSDWTKSYENDPYIANTVIYYRPTAMMTFPELQGKTEEIDAIFDYIDRIPFPQHQKAEKPHIPPSKVLAIWDTKFDGTILATRDFEDRMKIIHETCDERVFDLYARNLNEPLYELDQKAVKLGYKEFQHFADERVGKLNLSDEHQKNIQNFYEKAIADLRKKGKEAVQSALNKEREWDKEVKTGKEEEVLRRGMREAQNLQKEYEFNLENVCKQLGQTVGFQMHSESGTIVNIDKYVMDATVARKSTVITDPTTGKTAKITYEPFSVEIKESDKYNQLYVYLFSDEINSYQRLDFTKGKLNYNLNGDMHYKAVVIGINENGYFLYDMGKLSGRDFGKHGLSKVSEAEFNRKINNLNKGRTSAPVDLSAELKWLFKEQANYVEQKRRRDNTEFRSTIYPAIYSCGGKVEDATKVDDPEITIQ